MSLDGSPVETSRELLGTRARLRDDAGGFRLSVAYDPPPDRDLGGGFVLCEGRIRELAPLQLTGGNADRFAVTQKQGAVT